MLISYLPQEPLGHRSDHRCVYVPSLTTILKLISLCTPLEYEAMTPDVAEEMTEGDADDVDALLLCEVI